MGEGRQKEWVGKEGAGNPTGKCAKDLNTHFTHTQKNLSKGTHLTYKKRINFVSHWGNEN